MTEEHKILFENAFETAGLDKALVDNIIFEVNNEGGFHLDLKEYELFYNTKAPEAIETVIQALFD